MNDLHWKLQGIQNTIIGVNKATLMHPILEVISYNTSKHNLDLRKAQVCSITNYERSWYKRTQCTTQGELWWWRARKLTHCLAMFVPLPCIVYHYHNKPFIIIIIITLTDILIHMITMSPPSLKNKWACVHCIVLYWILFYWILLYLILFISYSSNLQIRC